MNRRTFLTGLLSTAAAVSTASGVVAIAPPQLTHEQLMMMFAARIRSALEIMKADLARKVFEEGSGSAPGGLASLVYLTDEEPVRYQHAEFGVEVAFTKEPC